MWWFFAGLGGARMACSPRRLSSASAVPVAQHVVLNPADALALVLERRRRERLPAAVLALCDRGRAGRNRRLELAVVGDVAEVRRALDVDQHLHAGDRPRRRAWEGIRGNERVGGGPVHVDDRRHGVAAQEERARRREDVEARRAALALGRIRERERGGREGLT